MAYRRVSHLPNNVLFDAPYCYDASLLAYALTREPVPNAATWEEVDGPEVGDIVVKNRGAGLETWEVVDGREVVLFGRVNAILALVLHVAKASGLASGAGGPNAVEERDEDQGR